MKIFMMSDHSKNIDSIAAAAVLDLISFLIALPIYGYLWSLIDIWQTQGLDAPPPKWKGSWKTYANNCLHLVVSLVILYIPFTVSFAILSQPFAIAQAMIAPKSDLLSFILTAFITGLLTPFLLAPYFLAAGKRTIGSVMRSIIPAAKLAYQRYFPILGIVYLSVILGFLSCSNPLTIHWILSLPNWILLILRIGEASLVIPSIIILHLMTQAFNIRTKD
jgi:hypothetical protein